MVKVKIKKSLMKKS